jgi:Fic family protein
MNKNNQFFAGTWRRAQVGTGFEYQYFLPHLLPDRLDFKDPNIPLLLEEATQKLGELNAYAKLVPDVDFFIKMHEIKEATESSKIEGTNTGIGEAVMEKEDIEPERRDDWQEVQNYVAAMRFAIDKLQTAPLATNLLRDTHRVLISGVRGTHKTPGELRKSQNWIGGATIRDAHFVPPLHTEIDPLLSDLDHYWHDKALTTPLLIKAGISHYQFETIHPFLDGNGRLGRLLIVLFLIEKNKLTKPILYLSDYFAKHRSKYYEALDAVRERNDIEHWIKFFLVAVTETADHACKTLQKIIDLKIRDAEKISSLGKRVPIATKLLNIMYGSPTMSIKQISEALDITPTSAGTLVNKLIEKGVLKELTGFARNRLFTYEEYLGLFG